MDLDPPYSSQLLSPRSVGIARPPSQKALCLSVCLFIYLFITLTPSFQTFLGAGTRLRSSVGWEGPQPMLRARALLLHGLGCRAPPRAFPAALRRRWSRAPAPCAPAPALGRHAPLPLAALKPRAGRTGFLGSCQEWLPQ